VRADTLLRTAEQAADGAELDVDHATDLSPADRTLANELAIVARIAREFRRLARDGEATDDQDCPKQPGDRWGHLELREIVGRGSYGTVFRAWDSTLERDVALKLYRRHLDPARVIDEGRKLAKVRHRNVVTVFGADVIDGVAGIWMEFVYGRRLDEVVGDHGPFSAREAALAGIELAGAVAAVHAAGLVHRDIKAQNVMRESGGRIVLMDLGASLDVGSPAAQAGDPIGTPFYMAPELFDRKPATRESDIYSLGVLLFYLVSARFPIAARTLGELEAAHRKGTVRSLRDVRPDLPSRYVTLVARMLAPAPESRYLTTGELEQDLMTLAGSSGGGLFGVRGPLSGAVWAAIGGGCVAVAAVAWFALAKARVPVAPPPPRSIAVLPIRNQTGDETLNYLAEGLTEILITDLANLRALRVPSYAAVSRLRDPSLTSKTLATQLHADLLLAGSIGVAGDRLRMTTQLIDPKTDQPIWGQTFTRERGQALAMQAEIGRLVAAQLSLTLTPAEERALTQKPVGAEAQDAFLRGLVEFNSPADERLRAAVRLFKNATDLEPSFAAAWAYEALALQRVADDSSAETRERLADGIREAAMRAIELDPGGATGYLALGALQFYYDWDFPAAEASFRKAVELSPSYALARQRYAMFLAAMRRIPEALEQGDAGRSLEPLVPNRVISYGFLYYYAHDFRRAAEETRKALAIDPNSATAHFALGRIAAAEGDASAAIREINLALDVTRNPNWLIELARVFAQAGRVEESDRLMRELDTFRQADRFGGGGDERAYVLAAAGRLDDAFRDLDEAVARKMTNVLWIAVDPRADPLRRDSRLAQLLKRMGL